MKNYRRSVSILFFLAIGLLQLHSQETISAAGGDASSAEGKVSYSIGQVFYVEDNDAEGSVTPGVQQAYEISVSNSVEEAVGINLAMSAYPNPTIDQLTLNVEDFNNEELSFQLFDMAGKLVKSNEMIEQNTIIYMDDLERGTYLLLINKDNKNIKTFKIIKN